MTVLCLTGCASSRKSVETHVETVTQERDSTVEESLLVTQVPVAMEDVALTVHTDSVLSLPDGASYHAQRGRARVDVRKGDEPGTIVVYASCDSLQRLVTYYQRQLASSRSKELQEEYRKEKKPPDILPVWLVCVIGVYISIILINKVINGKE